MKVLIVFVVAVVAMVSAGYGGYGYGEDEGYGGFGLREARREGYGGEYGRAGYGGHHGYYEPGFHHVANGVAAVYRNDLRQVAVNKVAEHYGAGTGTARFYGVPGTGGYYSGYRHGYGGGHGVY